MFQTLQENLQDQSEFTQHSKFVCLDKFFNFNSNEFETS